MAVATEQLVERIWARDPTVWTGSGEEQWLGWLDEPVRMRERIDDLLGFVDEVASPGVIIGALMYLPLLNRVRNEMAGMGMEPERLYNAVKRFKQLGERGERTWRVPTYQVLKRHGAMVVNPRHPYHLLANSMVWLSDRYPKPLLKPVPSWFKELTYRPAA